MQRIAELREKAIMDEKAIYRKGIKDGIKERYRTTECNNGVKKEKLEIAKNMLKKGMDLETVMDITGLTKEELKQVN